MSNTILDMEEMQEDFNETPDFEVSITPHTVILPKTVDDLRFDTSRVKIAELKEQYKGLTIAGIQDKDGIKVVSANLKALKKMRTEIENQRVAMKRPVLDAGALIDTEAKELTALLNEVIDPLDKEAKRIEKLQEAEKMRVFNELKALKDDRAQSLIAIGFEVKSGFYTAGEIISVSYDALGTLTGAEFTALCNKGTEEIQKIAAEKERKAKELEELQASRINMRRAILQMNGYKEGVNGWFLPSSNECLFLHQIKNMEDGDFLQVVSAQVKSEKEFNPNVAPAPTPGPAPKVHDVPYKDTTIPIQSSGFQLMLDYLEALLKVPVPQFREGSKFSTAIDVIRNYVQKNINAVKDSRAKFSKIHNNA